MSKKISCPCCGSKKFALWKQDAEFNITVECWSCGAFSKNNKLKQFKEVK